jgi:hypothetical protein
MTSDEKPKPRGTDWPGPRVVRKAKKAKTKSAAKKATKRRKKK